MPITYTNRKGQTYHLLSGPKRSGGIQYFFKQKLKGSGTAVDAIPEGFEVHESVAGQVFLRRIQPNLIHAAELLVIQNSLPKPTGRHLYRLEVSGKVVTIQEVKDNDQMMIITKNGIVIRCPVSGINVIGRNTQGVRLINLEDSDRVVDVAHLAIEDEDESNAPQE